MSQNHKLAKSIVDASFNKICQLLKWKTKILGKYYYQVDTYYPSREISYTKKKNKRFKYKEMGM